MSRYRICQQEDFRFYVQERSWYGWITVDTCYGGIGGTFNERKLFNSEREAEAWIDEDIAMYEMVKQRSKIPLKSPREYP